jgi:hypothetical protein
VKGVVELAGRWRGYLAGEEGAAVAEFAIWLTILVPAIINAADIGLYSYARTQVTNAAQAGAQAAWTTAQSAKCTFSPTQGTSNCTGLSAAVTSAISNSSVLGAASTPVQEQISGETEGYYCADVTSGALKPSSTVTCGSAAGYYYKVEVTYTYRPLFGRATVIGAGLLNPTMTQDAWIRLQ